METNTISNTELEPLIVLYDQHSKLFIKLINDILIRKENDYAQTSLNNVIHIANDLVQKRFDLANETDIYKNPQNARKFNGTVPLNELQKDWEKISPVLRKTLLNLDDNQLKGFCSLMRPDFDTDTSLLGAIGFFIYTETEALGQIVLSQDYLRNSAKNFDASVLTAENGSIEFDE